MFRKERSIASMAERLLPSSSKDTDAPCGPPSSENARANGVRLRRRGYVRSSAANEAFPFSCAPRSTTTSRSGSVLPGRILDESGPVECPELMSECSQAETRRSPHSAVPALVAIGSTRRPGDHKVGHRRDIGGRCVPIHVPDPGRARCPPGDDFAQVERLAASMCRVCSPG